MREARPTLPLLFLLLVFGARLVAVAAQPEQEPLRLEVRLNKTTLAPDSSLEFEVRVVNVSSEPVFVDKIFVNANTGERASLTFYARPLSETSRVAIPIRHVLLIPPAASDFIELQPGYFLGKRYSIKIAAIVSGAESEFPPPGEYEFRAAYYRLASHNKAEWPFKPWHGMLRSERVRFRIVAPPE